MGKDLMIMRALLATATVGLVLLTGTGTAFAATPAAASAPACQPGSLKAVVTTAGTSQEDMNHQGTFLKVTNVGKKSCKLAGGYAGLALEGAGHKALRTTVDHGRTRFTKDPGKHTVTLKHGASAWADLVWTHTGAGTAHAKYLQISPTGSNAHHTVAFNQPVDHGVLTVTAWSAKRPKIG
jgi:hypothetical protein